MNNLPSISRVLLLALSAALVVGGCKRSEPAEQPSASDSTPPQAAAPHGEAEPNPEAAARTKAPEPAEDEDSPAADAEKDAADAADATNKAEKRTFNVDTASSKIDFLMEAPLENIHGVARKSVHGSVSMNLTDLSTIRGKIRIDLDRLEIFQAKRESADGTFPDEAKNKTQNEHMKTWFQISPDAPKAIREKNRWIVFDINSATRISARDVTAQKGDKRSVRTLIGGSFTLHGKTTKQNALVQATFNFTGEELSSIRIRSLRPVDVSLAAHDIRPRSAFDRLTQKTLAALGQKVAEAAPIKFSFTLVP